MGSREACTPWGSIARYTPWGSIARYTPWVVGRPVHTLGSREAGIHPGIYLPTHPGYTYLCTPLGTPTSVSGRGAREECLGSVLRIV